MNEDERTESVCRWFSDFRCHLLKYSSQPELDLAKLREAREAFNSGCEDEAVRIVDQLYGNTRSEELGEDLIDRFNSYFDSESRSDEFRD